MLLSTLLIHFSCSKVDSAINLIKRHANRAMAVVDNNHSLSEEASLEALSSRAAAPRTILVESGRSRATASSAQVNVRCFFIAIHIPKKQTTKNKQQKTKTGGRATASSAQGSVRSWNTFSWQSNEEAIHSIIDSKRECPPTRQQ